MSGVSLRFDNVRVRAGERSILDIDRLDVRAGQATAVLGPNGAGKSTLVRIAAGVRSASAGRVLLDGRPSTPVERRTVAAAVLQRPLLGRGSVRRNAELGLRFARVPAADARSRADRWLERLGVAHLADRQARSLSGGEAQRVSLARALVLEPRLLVLDEPFAPLDARARGQLLSELHNLLAHTRTTTLLVTHDPGEAAALAADIVVLHAGAVRQHGPADEIFAHPCDETTARLLGYENILDAAAAARFGIPTENATAFRAADLTVTANPNGDAHVIRSIPIAGASHVTVQRNGATVTGFCALPGGLLPGTRASTELAHGRGVSIGATAS